MDDLEEELNIACPYCGAENAVLVDKTAARHQSDIIDCETCCRPMSIYVSINADGDVDISAKGDADSP